MSLISAETFAAYWSAGEAATNAIVILNIFGALLLGLLIGYERSYHGRAAGMRTYGLVCMGSAALTIITGYPEFWFGGGHLLATGSDPTRVIQGIVTGIGFLCAGVIMKEGFSISGLTTAASIWVASVIGILVGIGFFGAAMALTVFCAAVMLWVSRLEGWLPSRPVLAVELRFCPGFVPQEDAVRRMAGELGYEIPPDSLSIDVAAGCQEWRFIATSLGKGEGVPLSVLAEALTRFEGVESFRLSHARN